MRYVLIPLAVVLLTVSGFGASRQLRQGTGSSSALRPSTSDTAIDVVPPPVTPCDGVAIQPGDDLQQAVDAHPEGTAFCLEAGVHRLAHAVPKNGQRFIGEGEGTVLSGARVLPATDARRDDSGHYYWDGQTQDSGPHGKLIERGHAEAPNEGDAYSEELFVTAPGDPQDPPERYQRVISLSALDSGKWYFDYDADRIYMTDNPAELGLIETSVVSTAIPASLEAETRDVTIENLVVEKYASAAQEASIGGEHAVDWSIRYVSARYSHGVGVELGPGTLMEHCKIHHMGQKGLMGGGHAIDRPTVLRNTEVSYNKTLSFDPGWDAGGTKFTRAYGHGMIVENSWFHHNFGTGLWFDIDNYNVTIRSNRFEANDRWGVFYEISRQAKIYWNEALDTTNGPEGFPFKGAGISISNSSDVEVFENLVHSNHNGILVKENADIVRELEYTYREEVPHIERVHIHNNVVGMQRGVTGMRVENGDARGYWKPSHIQFVGNIYWLEDTARFLGMGNDAYTFDEWQNLGNDSTGRVLSASPHGSLRNGAKTFGMTEYGARETV